MAKPEIHSGMPACEIKVQAHTHAIVELMKTTVREFFVYFSQCLSLLPHVSHIDAWCKIGNHLLKTYRTT